jgi:hypothetical protein
VPGFFRLRRNCSQIAIHPQIAICEQFRGEMPRENRLVEMLDKPFVGSEAVASGAIRKHELRARCRAVFPDVYVRRDAVLTLSQRARAAWLYSHRQGIIAGLTASAFHGAKWVDNDLPIELIWSNARPPRGLRAYDMRLHSNEFLDYEEMRITSVERTAFDIGCRGRLDDTVARLDALGTRRASRPTMCLSSLIAIVVPVDSDSYVPRSTCTTPARNLRRKHGCGSC